MDPIQEGAARAFVGHRGSVELRLHLDHERPVVEAHRSRGAEETPTACSRFTSLRVAGHASRTCPSPTWSAAAGALEGSAGGSAASLGWEPRPVFRGSALWLGSGSREGSVRSGGGSRGGASDRTVGTGAEVPGDPGAAFRLGLGPGARLRPSCLLGLLDPQTPLEPLDATQKPGSGRIGFGSSSPHEGDLQQQTMVGGGAHIGDGPGHEIQDAHDLRGRERLGLTREPGDILLSHVQERPPRPAPLRTNNNERAWSNTPSPSRRASAPSTIEELTMLRTRASVTAATLRRGPEKHPCDGFTQHPFRVLRDMALEAGQLVESREGVPDASLGMTGDEGKSGPLDLDLLEVGDSSQMVLDDLGRPDESRSAGSATRSSAAPCEPRSWRG